MTATRDLDVHDPLLHGRLARLRDEAPSALRVRGPMPELARAIAVVGTRAADDDALAFAERLAKEVALAGVVVVSGGARGIDAAAHRGALSAGGATLAVLAGGLGRPYPPEHRALFDTMTVVSELPDDAVPHAGRFLRRNRLVAALADVVVVVQAPLPSGALSTAAWAKKLTIPVASVPHAPWDPRGAGCIQLVREGARVCTSASDVLQVPTPDASAPGSLSDLSAPPGLPENERAVLDALGRRARHVDEITAFTRLSAAAVQQALAVLMLMGLASSRGDGRWSRP